MRSRLLSALFVALHLSLSTATTFNRALCQHPTPNPLQGCPPGTLLVGPSNAPFTSIQAAISSLPNTTTTTSHPSHILILPGTYTTQLNITLQRPLYLYGQTSHPNDASHNTVNILWHNATGTASTGTYDNAFTSVLTVAPNLNASLTGSGPTGFAVLDDTPFGCGDFRTYNLNFGNEYLPYSAGPSLAVGVSRANAGFYYSQFLSYQDTVYVGKLGNAYMYGCIIAGETDFLYGFGTLYITHSTLLLRSCGGGITAWKGTNTTFPNKYGVYVHASNVVKANSSLEITGKCALGRPWNSLMRAVFAENYLDDSIQPGGYIEWSTSDPRVDSGTYMAEYRDYGPGFNLTARRANSNVTIELTKEEYEPYSSPEKVFQFPETGKFGNVDWIDAHPEA